jgi:DNA-binding response OmpR family regulator
MISAAGKRLLLVENDTQYRRSLAPLLQLEGYDVEEAETTGKAKAMLQTGHFDLALVDLRMAETDADHDNEYNMSGLDVAKSAREHDVPSIIVTAFPSVMAARMALRGRGDESLAEDFVAKADGPQAVLDAVGAVLERIGKRRLSETSSVATTAPVLRIDTDKQLVYLHEQPLDLSEQQYELMQLFFLAEDHHLTCQKLMMAIWGEATTEPEAAMDKRLQNLIKRVREKLQDDGPEFKRIVKMRSRGYRLITTV